MFTIKADLKFLSISTIKADLKLMSIFTLQADGVEEVSQAFEHRHRLLQACRFQHCRTGAYQQIFSHHSKLCYDHLNSQRKLLKEVPSRRRLHSMSDFHDRSCYTIFCRSQMAKNCPKMWIIITLWLMKRHQCNPGSGKKVTLTKLRREDSVRRGERAPTLRCIQRQRQIQIKRQIRRQRQCSERGKISNTKMLKRRDLLSIFEMFLNRCQH